MVRIAVATSESVFLIPHLAKMAVTPAKNAEPNANNTHMPFRLAFLFIQNTVKDTLFRIANNSIMLFLFLDCKLFRTLFSGSVLFA